MKKYTEPQFEIVALQPNDMTASGGIFNGIADLDKSENITFDDNILDPIQ